MADAYTEAYKESCFVAYYSAGRPRSANQIREVLPETDEGRKPTRELILKWKDELGWDLRADELDARASQMVDDNLVQQKAEILKRQAYEARQIAEKALDHIVKSKEEGGGFDSSSSAVQAYFRAAEQERVTVGLSEALMKLGKLTEEQLTKQIADLLERANAAGDVLDGLAIEENTENEE